MGENWSRRAVLAAGTGALAGLAGCSGGAGGGSRDGSGDDSDGGSAGGDSADGTDDAGGATTATGDGTGGATATATPAMPDWRTTELTDVTTGEPFTVEGLSDRPVVLEFFAVWCPVCTEQQREMGALAGRRDDFVPVSIDTDPNEDAETVRKHAAEEGFDWRYAVAPAPVTRAFVEEFGSVVTSPPSAPVVRHCPDGSASLFEGRGVKSADALASAVDGC